MAQLKRETAQGLADLMMNEIVTEALAILQNDWVVFALPVFLVALALEWFVA